MQDKTIKIYTKKDMLLALKKAKLPSSYQTLIKFENNGIIPKPTLNSSGDRIYSKDDIGGNIVLIRIYKLHGRTK